MFARITAALALAATGACTSADDGRRERLTVLAAASLTGAFSDLERAFEQANPGVDVMSGFGGSSALAQQIRSDAPVDVFASADDESMATALRDAEGGVQPEVFARNRLMIATPRGDKAVTALGDLARRDVIVVLCTPEVPCGRLAREALDRAGIVVTPRSYERDVKAVVAKVAAGEADAGIVYETDVRADPELVGVPIPGSEDPELQARYVAAALPGRRSPAAEAFVAFLTSAQGERIVRAHGFLAP